jgi:cobalt/nickel transport system ATP-binding protein
LFEAWLGERSRHKNLSFSFPNGQQALDNVSLIIPRGQTVAFVGPNGAGKSTLLLHLNGILRSDGRVMVMGKEVKEENLRWIRSKVGMVFQDPEDQLFSPPVFDDVAFGPINMRCSESEVRERVTRALRWVGMSGCEQRSPHHLSVGEKKRIALATVLSMDTELLILDEPTSNLDPAGKWSLIELLKGLPVAKIVASHDLEMVRVLCQRTVVLDGGRIVADGATEHILGDLHLLQAHSLAPQNSI